MKNTTEFNDGQSYGLVLGTMLGLTLGMIFMMLQPSMPLDLSCSEYKQYVKNVLADQKAHQAEDSDSFYY